MISNKCLIYQTRVELTSTLTHFISGVKHVEDKHVTLTNPLQFCLIL